MHCKGKATKGITAEGVVVKLGCSGDVNTWLE